MNTGQTLRFNWLQVFKRAPTALLGSGGGPEHRTRLVPSEKCAVSWGSDDDEMRMITARFVRAIERFAGDLCWHFLPLFQQVVEIRKTRNQLQHRNQRPLTLGAQYSTSAVPAFPRVGKELCNFSDRLISWSHHGGFAQKQT